MDSKSISDGILRAIAILAGVVALGYFLYLIQTVLIYLLFAIVVALIGRPIVMFLKNRLKFPDTLAVLVVILFVLGLLVGLIMLFIPVLVEQGKNLSILDVDGFSRNLKLIELEINKFFGRTPLSIDNMVDTQELKKEFIQGIEMNFIPKLLNGLVSVLSSFSLGLISVLFISFFFLKDSKLVQNSLLALVPDSKETRLINSIGKIKNLLSRYFLGLLAQIMVLFIIYTVTLLLVGVENALVIAFLCAIFNIIPWLGPLIALALMVILTITSHLGADFSTVILPDIGWVIIGFGIGQLIDNLFSQPLIFANAIKLHPLEIFLVILMAGMLFGVVGMIIAIPGYTAIKVILKEFLSENKFVKKLTQNM
ncbi:AI-2E family transporter [Robiginitalea aurantiaca]|uniref:AI-2E family transporter n=1 Tax=Robiginitalea aurantiaca TaxID=3056915 RepID=A0ABT7WI49_9FLAO|nr:AI-2E family transporter [Robiginitalea aurantiaca]MDM9632586.1 AI-2E family transporter [Robiginitalea aurantiaca]